MRAVELIRRKRDGHALSDAEVAAFVAGTAPATAWPDYQLSAMLMAILLRGMTPAETATLTRYMVESGDRLAWDDLGVALDKHSTGGIGDKTSLILAPLVAACGGIVPMMSGRGLGHTGGTLDKMEAIPGFRVHLSPDEMRTALRKSRCVIVSPTPTIAPADKKLYALRDVTATVESLPLISASIMSKKLAEGVRALVLDVKHGTGAFMKTKEDARALARAMVDIGNAYGVRTQAVLTPMNNPLGTFVGNALEVRGALEVLRGGGERDLRDLSVHLAARMLYLGGISATMDDATAKIQAALDAGHGLEGFRRMVEAQGGDPRVVDDESIMGEAPGRREIRADRSGVLLGIEAETLGRAVLRLGAGRDRAEDGVDPVVGAILRVKPGRTVTKGDVLMELHYRSTAKLEEATALAAEACTVGDGGYVEEAIVGEVIG